MLSYSEFYRLWCKVTQRKPLESYPLLSEDKIPVYYESKKYNIRIKFRFLYRMYVATGCMSKMAAFKRCMNRFFEIKDFRNWKRRMEWLGANYESHALTHDKFLSYYGNREGEKRWKSYCEKQSVTNTFEYKRDKYGMTEEEFKEFNKSRAVTLKNMTRKYGPKEGKRRYENYVELQKYVGVSLDYFIEKYGPDEGPKKYLSINSQKALTRDNFIRKYGQDEGQEKYEKFLNKSSFSKVSYDMNMKIINNLSDKIKHHEIFYQSNTTSEYFITNEATQSIYLYDFTIPDIKFAIEFNGDFYHANPIYYTADDTINPNGINILAKDIWERDRIKVKALEDHGFMVHIVWEHDYRKNPEEVVDKCVELINNRYKEIYGDE